MKLANLSENQSASSTSQSSPEFVERPLNALQSGDKFKATIEDIQPGRVTIRLASGGTLTARSHVLPEARIGEESIFMVKENIKGQILLEMLKPDNNVLQNNIIKEALKGSGLYATNDNIELVREMISKGMSLDSATLQKAVFFKYASTDMSFDKILFLINEDFPLTKKSATLLNSIMDKTLSLKSEVQELTRELFSVKPEALRNTLIETALKIHNNSPLLKQENLQAFISRVFENENENIHPFQKEQLAKDMPIKDIITREALAKEVTKQFFINLDDKEQLKSLNKFFIELNEGAKAMDKILKVANVESPVLSQSLENITDSLRFMEQINNFKEYMQIPFTVKGQENQGELYVFKDGKKKADYNSQASILIALDFSALGHVEVLVNKIQRSLNLQFRIEKDNTIKLINQHLPKLSEALVQKDYSISGLSLKKLSQRFALPNEHKAPEEKPAQKRYTFDMRV